MDIRGKCALWDLFYEASHSTIDAVLAEFTRRCVREGRVFTREMFVHLNKIKPIVDKRAEAIPADFTVHADPDLLARLKAWMEGPYCEYGRNFWGVLTDWYRLLERHGNLILVLTRERGKVYVSARSARYAVAQLSEDGTSVQAWQFQWPVERTLLDQRTGREESVTEEWREWIDAETWIRWRGEEEVARWDHGLGWIPVVHVAVNVPPGGIFGISVIEDLIEPQLYLDAALSTAREVNRWAGWPLFAGTVDPASVDLRPGGYTVDDGSLRAITWNVSVDSIRREIQDHLQDLYEKGRVLAKGPEVLTEHVTTPSGRALLVLSADGIQYVRTVCAMLEEKMSELLWKVAALHGWVEYPAEERPIRVVYPPLRIEDPDAQVTTAKVLIECYARGLLSRTRVLEALLGLGILPFEATPEELEAEAAAELHRLFEAQPE